MSPTSKGRRKGKGMGRGEEGGKGNASPLQGIKDPSPTKTDEPTEVPFGM